MEFGPLAHIKSSVTEGTLAMDLQQSETQVTCKLLCRAPRTLKHVGAEQMGSSSYGFSQIWSIEKHLSINGP